MFKRGKLEDFQAFSRYSAGDPVSSYLFLLATEGLLSLLTSPLSDEIIQGIQVALEAPHVNHLLFCWWYPPIFRCNTKYGDKSELLVEKVL